jgi:biotin carboxyl carrier protein
MTSRIVRVLVGVAVVAGIAAGGYFTRDTWLLWFQTDHATEPAAGEKKHEASAEKVILTDQAITNLGITAKPLKPTTYWKSLAVSGVVIELPGRSDRSVVAPATGVVTAVHRFPGDTVQPGDALFTLKLLSESLHLTQTELFKAATDIRLAQAQRRLLVTPSGVVSEPRLLELDNQIARLEAASKAHRQELLNRGLTAAQIDAVAEGNFVREIAVRWRHESNGSPPDVPARPNSAHQMQELKVELGQQVQAGQTLCLITDHRVLAVEGRVFHDEVPLVDRAAREGWPVEIDFGADNRGDRGAAALVAETAGLPAGAGPLPAVVALSALATDGRLPPAQDFTIRFIATVADPDTRTFAFRVNLVNQRQVIERDGRAQTLWRFRPNQPVRIHLRTEPLDNVFVLPADAVVREGPEWFVFIQNVNTFERVSVRALVRERDRVVIANDGAVPSGSFVAQSAAAQLNRALKSATTTVPKGFHVHADGSIHMDH